MIDAIDAMPPGEHDQKSRADGAQPGGHQTTDQVTPGKSTQTSEDNWETPPDRYAHLHQDIRHLLWRSRGHWMPADKPFWETLDEKDPTTFQTLTQIHRGTVDAGLWEDIDVLHERQGVYTNGQSWGVHFTPKQSIEGKVNKGGNWGKDWPQSQVQGAHPPHGAEYTWYRQNSGAGVAGLHVGVGSTNTNVHWDPTNPMDHVGNGWEVTPLGLMNIPNGLAVYSVIALISHAGDISNGGLVVDGHDAKGGTVTTDPFFSIDNLQKFSQLAHEWSTQEMSDASVKNAGRRNDVWHQITKAKAQCNDLRAESLRLSMMEAHEDPNGLAQLKARALAAREAIVQAFAAFWRYVAEDAQAQGGALDANDWFLCSPGDWGAQAENRNMGNYAWGKLVILRDKRAKAAASKK